MARQRILFLGLLFISASISAVGQENAAKLQLSSPHDAIWVHLHFLQEDSYQPALAAEAFPGTDSLAREKSAIRLKQILDGKGLYVHMNLLPQEQNYRDSISGDFYYTPFPKELPGIYLERSDEQWRYSKSAMALIPELHQEVFPLGTSNLVKLFSRPGQQKILGVSTWQLLGIGILLVLAFLANFLFSFVANFAIGKLGDHSLIGIEDYANQRRRLARFISIIVVIWLIATFLPILQLSPSFNTSAILICRILQTAFMGMLFLTLSNLLVAYLYRAVEATSNKMDDQIVPLFKRLLQIIIVVIALLHILRLLDVNITALIAGVSIGGLALALAAQDSVKNLLGSLMIFFDRPFQIDDWVEGADFSGSVIEVGFRSTRIKTVDTSIITVPNGRMADATVKNLGVREYRLFSTTLGIQYDTPTVVIEKFLHGLKQIIELHEHVSNEGYLVNLVAMSGSSLDISLRAYLIVSEYAMELSIKESLYLNILRWAEELGVAFAFPTQTLHVESIPGHNPATNPYTTDPEELENRWAKFAASFVDNNE